MRDLRLSPSIALKRQDAANSTYHGTACAGMGGGTSADGRDGPMRRALLGLAVAGLTVLALAGPAGAAAGQVHVFRFHRAFADAMWTSSTDTGSTETDVTVSTSRQGSELFVGQFTPNFEDGTFTGLTTHYNGGGLPWRAAARCDDEHAAPQRRRTPACRWHPSCGACCRPVTAGLDDKPVTNDQGPDRC